MPTNWQRLCTSVLDSGSVVSTTDVTTESPLDEAQTLDSTVAAFKQRMNEVLLKVARKFFSGGLAPLDEDDQKYKEDRARLLLAPE